MSAGERSGAAGGLPPVTGLSHIAIATRDAETLATTLTSAMGAVRGEEELLDGGALRVLFLHLGPVTLELLEPRSSEHTVARFLDTRGPGLHHLCFEVADLEAALARCRENGVQLINQEPRAGANGSRVAFLHPKSLGGVLVELREPRSR